MGHREVKVPLSDHSHLNRALVVDQKRGERGEGKHRVIILCNEGWGTYTHGWENLSSYVYYYFFFFPAILQEAEV